jgi:hypothetical protein
MNKNELLAKIEYLEKKLDKEISNRELFISCLRDDIRKLEDRMWELNNVYMIQKQEVNQMIERVHVLWKEKDNYLIMVNKDKS